MGALALRGYYAILDLRQERPPARGALLEAVDERLTAGPCMVQIRAKRLAARDLHDVAAAVAPVCRRAGVPLCINDRLDVALSAGADAVHVGQEDLPLAAVHEVLARLGRRLLVGVSTHDLAQLEAAALAGADYLGFGPVFPTGSKVNPDPVVGLETLARAAALVTVPIVAIGGITLQSVDGVARTGAAAAAVISAVDQAPDRTAAGRRIASAFDGTR